jgi:hypothetical protein
VQHDVRSGNGFEDLMADGLEPAGEMAVREDDYFHLVQHVDCGIDRQLHADAVCWERVPKP